MESHKVVTLSLLGGAVLLLMLILGSAYAQISLTGIGVRQTVDFDDFDGSGAFPDAPTPTPGIPGTLDTGSFAVGGMSDGSLPFGGTALSGDYARGISVGGVTTGGMYAFDLGGGDRVLGFQPTEYDMTPGVVMARITNSTGEVITALDVSYDVVMFNDENRATNWTFSWAMAETGPFTTISALDFVTRELADSIPSYSVTSRQIMITDLSWADGEDFYLRWQTNDVSGEGARDEIGINNLSLRGTQTMLNDGFETSDTSAWSATVP